MRKLAGRDQCSLAKPGSRQAIVDQVSHWLQASSGDTVTVVDPYFSPGDLEWIKIIRLAKPNCQITVLTGRNSQPPVPLGSDLLDLYLNEWARLSDQKPPWTKIVVVGGESSKKSPIHDRWILTSKGGLGIGTSLNSIGISKDSAVSPLSDSGFSEIAERIDEYLSGRKLEHNGERLRVISFWL